MFNYSRRTSSREFVESFNKANLFGTCDAIALLYACVRTPPVPAAVPPVGASPPSSFSAFGSLAECVCGHYAASHIQLRKSESVDTRQ